MSDIGSLRFEDHEIERVRHAANVVELVGSVVKLTRAGSSFKGCCPFHQEKTPSFFVEPEKKVYYCFGCGARGDAITFMQEMFSLSFADAIRELAHRHSISLGDGAFRDFTAKVMRALHPPATTWAVPGRSDCRDEGVRVESIAKVMSHHRIDAPAGMARLGHPMICEINDYVEGRGFSVEDLATKGYGGFVFGPHGGRLFIPCVMDGDLVFWQTRSIVDRQDMYGRVPPKYLSAPDVTSGICIYNLDVAKKFPLVHVVEGAFDAETVGDDAISMFGCRVTAAQARVLALRGFRELNLCFDPDAWKKEHKGSIDREPPVLAAGRAILEEGMALRVSILEGRDPNEMGRDAVREVLGRSKSVADVVFLESLVARVGGMLSSS